MLRFAKRPLNLDVLSVNRERRTSLVILTTLQVCIHAFTRTHSQTDGSVPCRFPPALSIHTRIERAALGAILCSRTPPHIDCRGTTDPPITGRPLYHLSHSPVTRKGSLQLSICSFIFFYLMLRIILPEHIYFEIVSHLSGITHENAKSTTFIALRQCALGFHASNEGCFSQLVYLGRLMDSVP